MTEEKPAKLRWPKYALGMLILWVLLYVIWLSWEVVRIKRIRKETDRERQAALGPSTAPAWFAGNSVGGVEPS